MDFQKEKAEFDQKYKLLMDKLQRPLYEFPLDDNNQSPECVSHRNNVKERKIPKPAISKNTQVMLGQGLNTRKNAMHNDHTYSKLSAKKKDRKKKQISKPKLKIEMKVSTNNFDDQAEIPEKQYGTNSNLGMINEGVFEKEETSDATANSETFRRRVKKIDKSFIPQPIENGNQEAKK